jgi:hypothetical protein
MSSTSTPANFDDSCPAAVAGLMLLVGASCGSSTVRDDTATTMSGERAYVPRCGPKSRG